MHTPPLARQKQQLPDLDPLRAAQDIAVCLEQDIVAIVPELARSAEAKGFLMVSSSPLTRSSYHAGDDFARLRAAREERLART